MMDVDGHVVTLRARVENIANRNYWSSVGGYPGNGYLVLGGPRTFSLSASMESNAPWAIPHSERGTLKPKAVE